MFLPKITLAKSALVSVMTQCTYQKVGHTTIMAASASTSCSITSVTRPTTTYSNTPTECSYSIASAVSFSTDI